MVVEIFSMQLKVQISKLNIGGGFFNAKKRNDCNDFSGWSGK